MKYRTKLLVLFVATALLTNGISLALLYHLSREHLLEQMRSTLHSIAGTTAALLEMERHETIKTRADEAGPNYQFTEDFLRKIRDANRRPDVYVRYIYTLRPTAGQGAKVLHFVVDAEETGTNKSHVGDPYTYEQIEEHPPDLHQPQILPVFIQDQWGLWLTGTVPLRDQNGRVAGILGVDIDARDVNAKLNKVLSSGLMSLLVSVVLAVAFSLVLSKWVSEPLARIRSTVEAIGEGQFETRLNLATQDEFAEVATAINAMALGLRQRENLKRTLISYVSKQVADEILASGQLPTIKGERRKVTVLFADVRGFTSLSERLPPEEIVSLLNEYFDRMIETIFRHQGTLNKFLGDGLMAMFGAPADDALQEEHAVAAALQMEQEVETLKAKFRKERDLEFRIGIGIHTGIAVVGNIGSQQKMEYTAIGDTVNTAARLESATKDLGADIVLSETTAAAVRNKFKLKDLGEILVKGKAQSLHVFAAQGTET